MKTTLYLSQALPGTIYIKRGRPDDRVIWKLALVTPQMIKDNPHLLGILKLNDVVKIMLASFHHGDDKAFLDYCARLGIDPKMKVVE